jgi:TRAP-type C4-dicarboxylate transport system permease small subunit
MRKMIAFIEGPLMKFEVFLAGLSMAIIMTIECLNAFGRKLLIPLPCCLEAAESLLIVIVFLGIGYVAFAEEHTQVTILTKRLRPSVRRFLDSAAYGFGAIIFGILACGAWPMAVASTLRLEIRIGVFHFPIWIFRLFFAVGLSLMSLQCVINALKFHQQASDPNWNGDGEVLRGE